MPNFFPEGDTPLPTDNEIRSLSKAVSLLSSIANQGGGGGISDAPSDGDTYGRKDGTWEQVTSGISDAPSDGTLYGRQDGDWEEAASPDDIPLTATFIYDGSANTTEFIVGDIPVAWGSNNSDLTQLSIGSSVTSIGSYAFYECTGLTGNLFIPNSVTTIGAGAFRLCDGFTGNLVIPSSVTSIGANSFGNYNNLFGFSATTLTGFTAIPNSYLSGTGISGTLILKGGLLTIGSAAFYYCIALTGSLVIPNSVTSIGGNAFGRTSFTGDLIIPNSVITIGDGAFNSIFGITNVVIPNATTSIGSYAFYDCQGLTNAYLNQPIGQIGDDAFRVANPPGGLTNIFIGPDATGYTLGAGQTIGGQSGITVSLWTNYPNVP